MRDEWYSSSIALVTAWKEAFWRRLRSFNDDATFLLSSRREFSVVLASTLTTSEYLYLTSEQSHCD